jgi:hypothetical protein
MKKITVIILMLVYGLSSSGTLISADYCCGKLSKIAVSLSQAENSKQDNQLENKKCCGHKEVNLKLKADHQTSVYQSIDFVIQPATAPVYFSVTANLNVLNKSIFAYSTGPPLYSSSCLFIKNCTFRI